MADYIADIPCDALVDFDAGSSSGSGYDGIDSNFHQEGTGCYYANVDGVAGTAYRYSALDTNIGDGNRFHIKFDFLFAAEYDPFGDWYKPTPNNIIYMMQLRETTAGKSVYFVIDSTVDGEGKNKWKLGSNASGSYDTVLFAPGWIHGNWYEIHIYGYVDNSAGWLQLWEGSVKRAEITGIDTYSGNDYNQLRAGVIYKQDSSDPMCGLYDYIEINDDESPSPPVEVTPDGMAHSHALDVTSGFMVADTTGLNHAHILDVATGTQKHISDVTGLHHAHSLDMSGAFELVTGSPADMDHAHSLDDVVAVAYPTQTPDDLFHAHALDSPAVSQITVGSPEDLLHGHTLDSPRGFREVTLYLTKTAAGLHRLLWDETGLVYVVVDGSHILESSSGYLDFPADFPVRGVLAGYAGMLPAMLATPQDIVRVTITSDDTDVVHHVERQLDGAGSWTRIASLAPNAVTVDDGPLDDGLWHYRIVAEDDAGNTATSATDDATVSSVPDPPSAMDYSWDGDTQTLTLSWTASPSDDIATYRVREGAGRVSQAAAPVYDGALLTHDRVFTTETGVYVWTVHAVDADSNEEKNISQVIALAFVSGDLTALPAEPRIVSVTPTAGGKIEVEWLYDPRYESPSFSGVSMKANIYYDNGTGTVDLDTPLTTVVMGAVASATRFTHETDALVNGTTYTFVVRISTTTGDVETQNVDEHSATANSSSVDTPTLSVEVV